MRARNLKPGFFKNIELADAGPIVQLLFAGLWCMADKNGRLKDQPRNIKPELFPHYEVDVDGELTVLERLGHIRRYEASGIRVIEVLNFRKHQSPHHTEKDSDLPEFVDVTDSSESEHVNHGEITVSTPKRNGGNPSDSLIPDSLIQGRSAPTKIDPRGTRIPEDFELTIERMAVALTESLDPDRTFKKFCDYWRSTPGAKGRKSDWDATWRVWCLKDADEKKPQASADKAKRAASDARALDELRTRAGRVQFRDFDPAKDDVVGYRTLLERFESNLPRRASS